MKPLLCMLGRHEPSGRYFLRARKVKGRHKWHKNYLVCHRCGKLIGTFAFERQKGGDG